MRCSGVDVRGESRQSCHKEIADIKKIVGLESGLNYSSKMQPKANFDTVGLSTYRPR